MFFTARRFFSNPIITPHMDDSMGDNINGPSLISVPNWVTNPLGKYYLYFAHHNGTYIRMAYADALAGPWKMHRAGVLSLAESHFVGHIASPDVHVDEANRQIIMYYHGLNTPQDINEVNRILKDADYPLSMEQSTRVATSRDGIHFEAHPPIEAPWYMRAFRWRDTLFALAMPGIFFRSRNGIGQFEPGPRLFTNAMRHCAVWVQDDKLHVFYTNKEDCPERILHAEIQLTNDWQQWKESKISEILRPETEYEGANMPLVASKGDAILEPVNQLRDPAVFEERGQLYLLYAVAGEQGIAIAKLEMQH